MLNPEQVTNEVIRPTLRHLARATAQPMDTTDAAQLLLGTALAESNLQYLRQLDGGPAMGLWQMEPVTHQDIWSSFLGHRPDLAGAVRELRTREGPRGEDDPTRQLIYSLPYACAMARVHYWRVPDALPPADDLEAQAAYWKQHYNTPLGAGTVEHYIHTVRRALDDEGALPPGR